MGLPAPHAEFGRGRRASPGAGLDRLDVRHAVTPAQWVPGHPTGTQFADRGTGWIIGSRCDPASAGWWWRPWHCPSSQLGAGLPRLTHRPGVR